MTAELHLIEQDSHKDLLCVNNKAEQQRISRKRGQTHVVEGLYDRKLEPKTAPLVFTTVWSINLHPQV